MTTTALPLDQIQVDRRSTGRLGPAVTSDLRDSIRTIGLLHPVTVTRGPIEGRQLGPGQTHYLLAGHRRYGAWAELHAEDPDRWGPIPVVEVDAATEGGRLTVQATENLQRHDLHWTEQAAALDDLARIGQLSTAEVAAIAGKTQPWAANLLRARRRLVPEWWDRACRRDGTVSQMDAIRLASMTPAAQRHELEVLLGTGRRPNVRPPPKPALTATRRPTRGALLELVSEIDAGCYSSRSTEWLEGARAVGAWAAGLAGSARPAVDEAPTPAPRKKRKSPRRR